MTVRRTRRITAILVVATGVFAFAASCQTEESFWPKRQFGKGAPGSVSPFARSATQWSYEIKFIAPKEFIQRVRDFSK